MPKYTLIATNPAAAMMGSSADPISRFLITVEIEGDTPQKALKAAMPRLRHFNYHPVSVMETGLVVPDAAVDHGSIMEAFPDDAVFENDHLYAIPEDAEFETAAQKGDVHHNRARWDMPIRSVTAGGENVGLTRLWKTMISAGVGFDKQAIQETYVTDGDEDVIIVIELKRDPKTMAARAWHRSEAMTGGPDRARWYHSRGGDERAAAAALMAAIRSARGLDPEVYPSQVPTP